MRTARCLLKWAREHKAPCLICTRFFLHQQGLDTTTPAGKAMLMGVFAAQQRRMRPLPLQVF